MRDQHFKFILALGIAAWLAAVGLSPRLLPGDIIDDGEYLVGARAIAEGHGYVLPSRPGVPRATKYPPGTSLLAVPFIRAWPGTDAQAGRLTVAMSGVVFAVFATAGLIAAGAKPLGAAASSVLTILHVDSIQLAGGLMSDVPFAAVSALATWHWYRTRWSSSDHGFGQSVLAGMLGGVAVLVRVVGITLVCGLFVGAITGRRNRVGGLVLGLSLVLLPVHLWLAGRPKVAVPEVYSSDLNCYRDKTLGEVSDAVIGRAFRYTGSLADLVAPVLRTNAVRRLVLARPVILATVGGLLVAAFFASRVKLFDLAHLPVAVNFSATVVLLGLWPWDLGLRPFLSFCPIVIYGIGYGGTVVSSRFSRVVMILVGAFAIYCLLFMTVFAVAMQNSARLSPDTGGCLEYLRSQTPTDAVVITHMPEAIYLATGRQAIKGLPDRYIPARVLGDWSCIDDQLTICRGRPLYMWGQASSISGLYGINYDLLREAAPQRIRIVHMAPCKSEWVAQVVAPAGG